MATTAEQTSPVPAPDLDAIAEQTQSAALRLMKLPALNQLRRDLRAMKDGTQDEAVRKALRQAIRQAATEKRRRKGNAAGPEATGPGTKANAGKGKRVGSAGKSVKPPLSEAEKAERKAAREAAKLALADAGAAAGEGARKPDAEPGKDESAL